MNQTLAEQITEAAVEAASRLAAADDGEQRNIIIVAPVTVFSNVGEVVTEAAPKE